MFFDNWMGIVRVIVVGALSYVSLIFLLRASGKRTLSKMNAFDFIVTIALGSTLATVLLSKDIALLEGITAFLVLVGLQFLITWLSSRFKSVSDLVKSEPQLIFHNGNFLWKKMKSERINDEEILQAMRGKGISDPKKVDAVILETDGSLSIIGDSNGKLSSILPKWKKRRNKRY